MTRKHYKAIADILNRFDTERPFLTQDMVSALCIYFKSDNENFNATKFMDAIWSEDGS